MKHAHFSKSSVFVWAAVQVYDNVVVAYYRSQSVVYLIYCEANWIEQNRYAM